MSTQLQKHKPSESERDEPCWNLGSIEINQDDARSILGEPHFIETNPNATAGGTEDLWTFKPQAQPVVFFRLRVPYSRMDVHVTGEEIPNEIWGLFSEVFPGYPQHPLPNPFDEMRHPDDPGFYICW